MAGASQGDRRDREAAPLVIAKQLGAIDVIQPSARTADAVKEMTASRGAEFVFDTVGSPATLTDAIQSHARAVVITGLSSIHAQGALRLYPFVMHEMRLIGSVYGSGDPLLAIERLVNAPGWSTQARRVDDETYRLDEVNEALTALTPGEGGRGVIFPQPITMGAYKL